MCWRSNEERLERLGDTLSEVYRKIRKRRINVNIKINVFVFVMEIVGGVLIALSGVLFNQKRGGSDTVMLTGVQIWYGCVIPSCYLFNSEYIKDTIMEHGWIHALSKVFTERPLSNNERSVSANNSIGDNGARINESNSNPPSSENDRKFQFQENSIPPRTPRIAWE